VLGHPLSDVFACSELVHGETSFSSAQRVGGARSASP
jgi:hypothetical protein